MIHGQHRVRLATTESGLKLNDGFSTLPYESLRDLRQKKAHSFGDEGALIERAGVLVLPASPARVHRRNVGGELRLLKGTLQHVAMGNSNFSPGLHGLNFLPNQTRRAVAARAPSLRQTRSRPSWQ